MRILYMPEAEENLRETLEYGMKNWGLAQALSFLEDLSTTLSVLLEYPQLGSIIRDPKLGKGGQGLRSIVYKQYRIIYAINEDVIQIIAILPKGRPQA